MSVARQEATINQRFSLRSKLDRCIHHWECPGCHYCRNCSANIRFWVALLVFKVVLAIAAIVLAIVFSVNDSGDDDNDYADTSFSSNETRLVVISSFFTEQAEITVDTGDHFSANATLYLVNQQPPLTAKFHVSRSTIVREWLPDQFPWHYYLHPNSNVTIKACLRRPCDPFYLFIIKGPQNFKNWKSSQNVKNAGEKRALITKYCSDGMQQVNYTTKEDDHYYLFPYTDSVCFNENYVDDSGTANLLIEKSEYSVSDIKVDGVCNTYELPSCSLSVPLHAGYERALIAVQGQDDETYSISFSSSNRVWAYCVVIIPPVILLVISGILTIGCICHKLRSRRNYSPL